MVGREPFILLGGDGANACPGLVRSARCYLPRSIRSRLPRRSPPTIAGVGLSGSISSCMRGSRNGYQSVGARFGYLLARPAP
jgi:hypothetical protein